MKKIFSISLICCAAFAFANDEPIFEETDEKVQTGAYATFSAEEPIFEEEEDEEGCNTCGKCGNPKHSNEQDEDARFLRIEKDKPQFEEGEENPLSASYTNWTRYKSNFGMEKLFIRFPQKPAVSQSNALLTAYAYDYGVLYSLTGYFPPVGSINPVLWFDEILYSVDHYPYSLVSHAIYQVSNGDWVMDYVTHDYVQNLIVKAKAIVTPFNGYTVQCVKPNGSRDYFDYFLDNFYIRCECR